MSAPGLTIEQLLECGQQADNWIDEKIHDLPIASDDRSTFAAACLDLVQEHCKAIRRLIGGPPPALSGSAFALVRPTFETFIRGLWLRYSATDKEVARFANNDRIDKTFAALLAEVESLPGFSEGALGKIKTTAWDSMCSYTHGGQFQAVRRMTSTHVGPAYADEEVAEVLRFSVIWTCLAGVASFQLAERLDLAEEVVALSKELLARGAP